MLLTDLRFASEMGGGGLTETRMEVVASVSKTEEYEFIQALTQNLTGPISLRQLLSILAEHEEQNGPLSPTICNWCPDRLNPDPARHPNGSSHVEPKPSRILVTVQTPEAPSLAQQVVIERSVKQQMTIEYVNVLNGKVIPVHLPLTITAQVIA